MKVFSCDLVDGKMIVDTSIVYQDVEFAESPFDLGKVAAIFSGSEKSP
jgi:hypothetical protein